MPSRNRTRHFDRNKFEAHLIRENANGRGQRIRFLQSEEKELDKLAEDEFRQAMKMEAIRKLGFPFIIIRPEDLNNLRGSPERKLRFYFDLAVP